MKINMELENKDSKPSIFSTLQLTQETLNFFFFNLEKTGEKKIS